MFAVEDIVMYGSAGVCKIADIRTEKFSGEETLYYILKPIENQSSTIYCPLHSSKVQMRRLLSKEEICDLIESIPEAQTAWIENEHQRKDAYTSILKQGKHSELIVLLKTLYFNQEKCRQSGKKFHAIDEKILKEAEKRLYGEFAYVLHIRPEEIGSFIMEQLKKDICVSAV